MSRHASELCALLVDDIYGELTSLLFRALLRHGRLSIPALRQYTGLTDPNDKLIKHGLAVLVQHQLVFWYTSDDHLTIYEANIASSYALVRSGKYVQIAEDLLGDFAGEVISSLLSLGHAQIGDLLEGFGVGSRRLTNGSLATPEVSNRPHLNGKTQATKGAEGRSITFDSVQATLCDLLRIGLISEVHESHFRSEADNRIEAEKVVPPPEYYKAKSKKENDAQWEVSIKKKLAEWKHNNESRNVDTEPVETVIPKKSKKRQLEDQGEDQPKKRVHTGIERSNGATGPMSESKTDEGEILGDKITLRINHAKFAVILRNNHLIGLVDQSICTSTSKVYTEVLHAVQPNLRDCKDDADQSDDLDTQIDLDSLPQISTDELVIALKDSAELANALGTVDDSMIDSGQNEHRKKRRRKEEDASENEVKVDGDASSDEDEDRSSDDDASNISTDSVTANGQADYAPNPPSNTIPKLAHRETIRNHLLLLAHHPLEFLHHFPQTAVLPERWTVDFPTLMNNVTHNALMHHITSRHGVLATRLVRILMEEGRVGEKELCTISLIKQQNLRSYLATLHQDGVAHVQEVPRDNSRAVQRTLFLWFFDAGRYKAKLLEDSYKAMTRYLQRTRVEGEKVKATVEKASRSDVIGKEEKFLTIQEREALEKWRTVEERIWGEVGRLDDLIAVIRDF